MPARPWLLVATTMTMTMTACDRTPPTIAPDDTAVHPRHDEPATSLGACVTDAVTDAEQRLDEKPLRDHASRVGPLLVVSAHRSCGNGGCSMELYAPIEGCTRSVASVFGGGVSLLATSTHGMPDVMVLGQGRQYTEVRLAFDGRRYAIAAKRECATDELCGPWKVPTTRGTVHFVAL